MAYQIKYQLLWSTQAGGSTEYRLDIEQEGYTGSLQKMVGAASPVHLEYVDSNDIYEPVIGSKLDINLLVTDDVDYDDFRILTDADGNLDPRAYRVTLRYRPDGDTSYSTYWRGFITPNDAEESFSTTPYPIKLTATDGLNLVSDQQLVSFTDDDPTQSVRVGEYIFDVVHQTGTQLPIRVWSDIRDGSNMSIIENTCNGFVFYDEEYAQDKTKVEAMKSILTAYNARLFQSKGVWNVISNSNHGGTISGGVENGTYIEYTYNDDSDTWDGGSVSTENLLKQFPTDLYQVEGDLVTFTRRPYFSIENQVSNQNGIARTTNSFFSEAIPEDGPQRGPHWENKGLGKKVSGDTKNYGTTRVAHGNASGRAGTHYVSTTRTNNDGGSDYRDVWFEMNIPYGDIREFGGNLTVIANQNWTASNVHSATIGVSFALEYQNNDYFVWNFENNQWDQRKWNRRTAWNRYWTHLNTDNSSKGVWNTFNVQTMSPGYSVRSFFEALSVFNINDSDILHIRIGDIRCYDAQGKQVTPNSAVTTGIDAVLISNNINPENPIEPFYELYQSDFSETYSYETDVFSDGPEGVRGKLNKTSFKRLGKNEDLSLERLVMQQKLNDFRDNLHFYQGSFINKSDGPLHFIDKIRQNYSDADSVSCIQQGFSFEPKMNKYSLQMYRTNQASDVSATFTKNDVYPQVEDYRWKEDIIQYEYELDFTGVTLPADAPADATIDDYIRVNLPKLLDDDDNEEVGKWGFTYYAQPGEVIRPQVLITAQEGYEINGSNFDVTNLDELDTAENVEFTDLGVDILLTFTGEVPDYSQVEQFTISGEVDELVGENQTVHFDSNQPANTTVSLISEQIGNVGHKEAVILTVVPEASDKEITKANSSLTVAVTEHDGTDTVSGVVDTSEIQEHNFGTGIQYIIPYTYNELEVDITFTLTVTLTDLAEGVNTSTITINASEGGSDTGNWSIQDTSHTITGVVGTPFQAFFEIEADSGRYFSLDSVSATIDDNDSDTDGVQSAITNTNVTYTSHKEYHIIAEGVFPSEDSTTSSVTVSATTQSSVPQDATNVTFTSGTNTLTNTSVALPLSPQVGLIGTTELAIYTIEPDAGYEITTAPTWVVTDSSNIVTDTNITAVKVGTGYQIHVPFTYAASNATFNLAITASATQIAANVNTSTITITATETGSNAAQFVLADTSLSATGVEGTTTELVFQVEAASGYNISNVNVGSTDESLLGTIREKYISDYEVLVFVEVTFGAEDASATLTFSATTSDDDGDEVQHTVTAALASGLENASITVNSGANNLQIDPGDTTSIVIAVEGDAGYDVSGLTAAVSSGDSWLASDGVVEYKVAGGFATVKEFHYTATGQTSAQTATVTISGTPDKVEAIDLVMQLDSTDSGTASVNKTHLKWTYSEDDTGSTGSPQTFTVQSNDPMYSYNNDSDFSAGQHFIEGTQSGSSSLGTFTVSKARSGGVFTFTVTPTFGSVVPSDGRYDGYFVLVENNKPYADATSAQWVGGNFTVPANANHYVIEIEANGRWIAYKSSTNGYSSLDKGWNDDPNGRVVVSFDENTTGSNRTSTFQLYGGSSIIGKSPLANLTITQSGSYSTESNDVSNIVKISQADYDAASFTPASGTLYAIPE